MMKLVVKNMVCPRCIAAVEQVMKDNDAAPLYVNLGEVVLPAALSPEKLKKIKADLEHLGFELLDDARKQQIEKIKSIIIKHIHHDGDQKFIFSEIISKALKRDYSQLSKLFSETEGVTIEQYVILQKVEKVKELLVYGEMNINEIAMELGYSSSAHLSAQFKKVTGLTPSQFKNQGIGLRKTLDKV
ncbi:MAG: helix-turn-helix transcriptional regulator [Bacteroidota bacterium]|nr:helix-turn-helix transcriptional regulator [Bacteroidota bacterium]